MDDSKHTQPSQTDDFKSALVEDMKAAAEEVAFWEEFWKEWISGGMRKRHRYRTAAHGARRVSQRKMNKNARIARRANRRAKKRRSR